MGQKYFGTDGIRGRVGTYPITPEFCLRPAGLWERFSPGKIGVPASSLVKTHVFLDICSSPSSNLGFYLLAQMSAC